MTPIARLGLCLLFASAPLPAQDETDPLFGGEDTQ